MTASKFRLFLFFKIPLAYMAGIRLVKVDTNEVVLSMKHSRFNQNPFRSIYFGALSMCAEISTGLLVMNTIEANKLNMSMLVTELNATFTKKAVGKIHFTCDQGNDLENTIVQANEDGMGHTTVLKSVGIDEDGDEVATFYFTWSIKKRSRN